MAGRRGARAGRGWDAIPPRPDKGDPPDGDTGRGGLRRGNAAGRRRRAGPGESGLPGSGGRSDAFDGFGARSQGSGGRSGTADGFGARSQGSGGWSSTPDGFDTRSQGSGGRSGAFGGVGAQSEAEAAREICLRQLAVRPRTRAELAKALTKREISAEVIAEVLDRYDEVGIIDDAAFARAWVSSRHHGRGLARRALAQELRQRGVDAEVATEALETLDADEEASTARALVDRKLRTTHGPPEAVFRRLVGMLARKGYPAGVAIGAVKDALAARDAEAAEFAEQIDPDAMANEADSLS